MYISAVETHYLCCSCIVFACRAGLVASFQLRTAGTTTSASLFSSLYLLESSLISKKRRLDKPWYTSDLFKLCRKKDRTAHDWMPSHVPIDI